MEACPQLGRTSLCPWASRLPRRKWRGGAATASQGRFTAIVRGRLGRSLIAVCLCTLFATQDCMYVYGGQVAGRERRRFYSDVFRVGLAGGAGGGRWAKLRVSGERPDIRCGYHDDAAALA